MRIRFVLLALGLAFVGQAFADLGPGIEQRIAASIVKVRVVNETRRVATGSDVHFSKGTVKALHLYEGVKVIQTDATFASGESGGALVDRDGKVVGILTFYASGRSDSYFAVPARWVRDLLERAQIDAPAGGQSDLSFWERQRARGSAEGARPVGLAQSQDSEGAARRRADGVSR